MMMVYETKTNGPINNVFMNNKWKRPTIKQSTPFGLCAGAGAEGWSRDMNIVRDGAIERHPLLDDLRGINQMLWSSLLEVLPLSKDHPARKSESYILLRIYTH